MLKNSGQMLHHFDHCIPGPNAGTDEQDRVASVAENAVNNVASGAPRLLTFQGSGWSSVFGCNRFSLLHEFRMVVLYRQKGFLEDAMPALKLKNNVNFRSLYLEPINNYYPVYYWNEANGFWFRIKLNCSLETVQCCEGNRRGILSVWRAVT